MRFLKLLFGNAEKIICGASLAAILSVAAVQLFNFSGDYSFQEKAVAEIIDTGVSEGDEDKDIENDLYTAVTEPVEFADGKGVITINCRGIRGGGVYIFVNGCIEADIRGEDPVTMRVNAGDVIIAMGHDLNSESVVKITAALGKIDCGIAGKEISVGNKGKLLAIIKKNAA